MAYGKNRATSYTDYYKNNSETSDDQDREKSYSLNISMMMPKNNQQREAPGSEMSTEDKKKAAIRRRLQKMRAGK